MDPILRLMRCKIPPHLGLVRAFADDVGVVSRDIYQALSLALEVCIVAAGAAGLILHLKKTVIVVYSWPSIVEFK
eukprot:6297208-Pyramimonas_sp.AAC.1